MNRPDSLLFSVNKHTFNQTTILSPRPLCFFCSQRNLHHSFSIRHTLAHLHVPRDSAVRATQSHQWLV